MNDNLSIGVVVPVCNGAAFLGSALDSLLAQQGCALAQVVVVDDGSTDDSAAVAAAYPAPVRVIRQTNAGAAAARNRGLAAVDADCVAFLDADDLLPPGSLAARAAPLRQDAAADATIGLLRQFVSPELDPAAAARFRVSGRAEKGIMLGAMLIRRRVFARVGGFDTALAHGDFMDWYLRARAAGLAPRAVAEVVLHRRVHGGNMTLRDRQHRADYLTVVRRHLARRG